MSRSFGLIGLPNVGKSTLFNALAAAQAEVSNYPFCTIDPNIGVVAVPDERLAKLSTIVPAVEITPATMKFIDIAGLVEGASQGEGLGNQFLARIREVDGVLHVVRCFQNEDIPHVCSTIDPVRDAEIIELELIQADREIVQRRQEKLVRLLKQKEKKAQEEKKLLDRVSGILSMGKPLRAGGFGRDRLLQLGEYNFLTAKPLIYLANMGEDMSGMTKSKYLSSLETCAERVKAEVISLCGKLEMELSELQAVDRETFIKEMGLEESVLNKLIEVSYNLLGLITFYTVTAGKIRAWSIERGTGAQEAAGKVHSDMQRGFIKAEVVSFTDLCRFGSLSAVRDNGLVRIEGREYTIQDGDVVYFRFH